MVDAVDLYNACLFIQDNLDADLSLMFLAQTVGLSRFRFHRVFKAWCGETLHDFVTRLRMERAAFELSYPIPSSNKRSVKAIAFASGYKSLSSFSHAFSSYSNLSPRQFRHQVQSDRVRATRALLGLGQSSEARSREAANEFFAPCRLSIVSQPARRLEILGPVADSRHAIEELGAHRPIYAVESMPGLFARRLHPNSFLPRTTPLSCVAVEAEAEGAGSERSTRRASLSIRGGRYAVLEGDISLAQLYRVWRRRFDAWLVASGECPSADRIFASFPDGIPKGPCESRRVALYIPLELLDVRSGAGAQTSSLVRSPEVAVTS